MELSGSCLGLGPSPAHSPSFNEYSSGTTIADIAARVAPDDAVSYSTENDVVAEETKPQSLEVEEEDDSSFEFPVPDRQSADGEISPRFPVFNTDLVFADTDWRESFDFSGENCSNRASESAISIRIPLKMLMISERETSVTESASCSSSEADDLEGVAPESYCVWNPTKEEMRRKSKSTGYSKRWKIRDLLYRSNSDCAEAFVPLPSKKAPAMRNSVEKSSAGDEMKKQRETATELYMKSNAIMENDRKSSYAPFSKDSVGFFAKMNELSRTIQPF